MDPDPHRRFEAPHPSTIDPSIFSFLKLTT